MRTSEVLKMASDLASTRRAFVMMTVVATQGSTPRDPGARMIWTPDGESRGTVGGGQFEELVKDAAQRCYETRSSSVEHFVLGADADQCCGGTLDVFVEFIGPRQRIVLFGAGHVSRELARLLLGASLEIVVVDDREQWNTQSRFEGCRRVTDFDAGIQICREHPEATMACVMTCSHDRDFELMVALLDTPPAYLGLIGSRSKRACFFTRLTGAGIGADRLERIRCPMGVGDTGKEPELVAISIAGELLIRAGELGTL